jgi:hypothetical protein
VKLTLVNEKVSDSVETSLNYDCTKCKRCISGLKEAAIFELARHVGGPPIEWSVETKDGPLKVEVAFGWAVAGKDSVRVSATAYGPSWWRLDRLEETVTVPRPSGHGRLIDETCPAVLGAGAWPNG